MIVFVTSFNQAGYLNYGRTFLEGFVEHFPKDAKLLVYYEDEKPAVPDSRITYINLKGDVDLAAFLDRHKDDPLKQGIVEENGTPVINYRFQATKFAHKVFALTSDDKPVCDWLVWLDADVEVKSDMPDHYFNFLMDEYLVYYLGRKDWHHSECGFVAYNMKKPKGKEFLVALRTLYTTDAMFEHKEWHDSYLFDRIREEYEKEGEKTFNLSKGVDGLDVWPYTVLGKYLVHHKGPKAKGLPTKDEHNELTKNLMKCPNRYAQLDVLIAEIKPWHIVEVGTWNGDRAIQMITEALKHREKIEYTGFDLFEEASAHTDATELNVKAHFSVAEVKRKLDAFAKGKPVTITLVPGNTRETLPGYNFGAIDLAFVDGGHSVQTILSDHEALDKAGAKVIVHDDWYLDDCADTEQFGCNTVLKDKKHMVLPVADKYESGMHIAMVVCGQGMRVTPKGTPPAKVGAEGIKTRNCVADEVICANVKYVMERSDQHVTSKIESLTKELEALKSQNTVKFLPQFVRTHNERAYVVGGDDTIQDAAFWNALEAEMRGLLFVTKTSHDLALAHGLVPYACFLLDPRPHVADAFTPDKRVRYFVSSMCAPEVYQKLMAADCEIYGYHAGVHAGEDAVISDYGGGPVVFGGTTAGMRGLNVLYILGFRNFELYGFNCSYREKPKKAHGMTPKPIYNVDSYGRQFLTDAELLAQIQDIEVFSKMLPDATVRMHGDGMGPWVKQHVDAKIEPGSHLVLADCLKPFLKSFNEKNEIGEAYWLEEVLKQLGYRQKRLKPHLRNLPTFKATMG